MFECTDNQEVGLEAAILERVRNSSLVKCSSADNVTGLKLVTEAAGVRGLRISHAVAERSVSLRRRTVRCAGGIGSENADMSSDKQGERPCRRKSKGSCARLIRAG